jgi:glycosyltransferase involved in cell wall biosynthesis
MKITQVSPFFPPHVGGLETYVFYVSRGLVQLGHEVTVITSKIPKSAPVREVIDGVQVVRLEPFGSFFGFPFLPSLLNNLWWADCDVIHGHINSPLTVEVAALVSKVRGTPFVLTYHADMLPEDVSIGKVCWARGFSLFYERFLKSFNCQVSRKIILTSSSYLQLSKFTQKFEEKVIVVPNGVDLTRFNPSICGDEVRNRLTMDNEKLILFVGRLVPYKGLVVLFRAFSEVLKKGLKARLVLVGNGPLKKLLVDLAEELDIQRSVVFIGEVLLTDLPSYYRAADVFVLPSRSRSEAFGLAMLEAMACGVPIIATEVGGIPFVLKGNGILVPPGDSLSLVNAILNLLKNDDLRRMLGKQALIRAREFSWDQAVKEIERVYASTTSYQ